MTNLKCVNSKSYTKCTDAYILKQIHDTFAEKH